MLCNAIKQKPHGQRKTPSPARTCADRRPCDPPRTKVRMPHPFRCARAPACRTRAASAERRVWRHQQHRLQKHSGKGFSLRLATLDECTSARGHRPVARMKLPNCAKQRVCSSYRSEYWLLETDPLCDRLRRLRSARDSGTKPDRQPHFPSVWRHGRRLGEQIRRRETSSRWTPHSRMFLTRSANDKLLALAMWNVPQGTPLREINDIAALA